MQNVLSSRPRMEKVVADIVFDFSVKRRLNSERGNAILVASNIYEACRYYEMFQNPNTGLRGKCAVVTSYNPQSKDITTEETGANTESDKQYIFNIYEKLLESVKPRAGKSKTETYEDDVKKLFKYEPANMKLLIVVDKLLTGFDAPSCTYLYIDKSMQDHGLFQAICRVNRLDGSDKDYGYIVDYKDLFPKVENAISVYTSELEYDGFESEDCGILLKERLKVGREKLDTSLESLEMLCEDVKPPKSDLEYIHYFCGNTELPDDLKSREPLRSALYKATVSFIRSYANIADQLEETGYSENEIQYIKNRMDFYVKLREVIRRASNETLDLKSYEADMRHLLDCYIQAEDSVVISPFGDTPLIDIIVKAGIDEAVDSIPEGLKLNKDAVAEVIENNVRSIITREHLLDPAYFERMSKLLDELIKLRREKAIAYKKYLEEIAELAKKVATGQADNTPSSMNTPAKRALYNNIDNDESLALQIDAAIKVSKSDGWRGNIPKENEIKIAIWKLVQDEDEVERIFNIITQQEEY